MDKMKNAIQYYYGLYPNDIHQSKGSYQFHIEEEYYYLTPYQRSIEELPELSKISRQLFERGVFCHQFVLNIRQELITVINQIPYVLLRIFVESTEAITMEDILFFSNLVVKDGEKSPIRRNHWKQLWIEKNDYFEYQVSQFGKQFPKIRESFSYFIGISEIGIALLNEIQIDSLLVISHRRIGIKDTRFDFYNPLNFILDYKERDLMEYCKEKIWDEQFSFEILNEILKKIQFQESELKLLLARAFYPTFYFDRYEAIINDHMEESILDPILENIDRYEKFLNFLYLEIRSKIMIPDMYWLTKSIG